jgi:hypothetical protein
MASLGGYGSTAVLGSPKRGLGSGAASSGQSLSQYGTPLSQASQTMLNPTQLPNQNLYQGQDANYVRNLATGYSPQQVAQMKTSATNVQAAGNRGMNERIREMMAAQGLSGGGAETGALTNAMVKSNANLGNTMSGIDISNAQTDLANRAQKAGMMNQLLGTGLNENQQYINMDQFNKGLYSDMYKWGKQFDYGKGQDALSNQQYQDQLEMMMQMYGMGNGASSGTPTQWARAR